MPGAVAKKKRKEEFPEEDRFLESVERGISWVQTHSRSVVLISVGLVLLVGGVLYYRSYRESLRTRAAIELNQLRATLTVADAVPRLTGFVARFDGTPSATEGRLLLAKIQLQDGRPQEAIEVLRPIAGEAVDSPSGYAVRLLLAEAHKNAGDYERSLDELQSIIDGAYVPYQKHHALAERGRLLAQLGRLEEAEDAYQRLVDDETATDDVYRVRLGQIQAMIAHDATPDPTMFAAPRPASPETLSADSLSADPAAGQSAGAPSEALVDSAAVPSTGDSAP